MARKTAPDWTEAEDEWLREYYPVMQNWELAEFKALDGWPRDEQAICRRAKKLGIRKDPSLGYVRKCRTPTIWTPEKDEWFRKFVPGHTEREISAEHERLWGFPLTESQIANRKLKLGVKSGTHGGRFVKGQVPPNKGKTWDEFGTPEGHARSRATTFRRGHLPHNTRPLLDTRVTRSGQAEIHVGLNRRERANDQWIPLAQFNWMQANGRDWPDGCKALHIDGDSTNDEADNIEPVPSDLWPLVIGAVPGGLEWHDRETLRTAILYARVTRARVNSERRARIAAGKPRKGDLSHATTEND
jgi:hypothetical protein